MSYNNTEPVGGSYSSIRNHVLWHIEYEDIEIENPDELGCVIDMPYEIDMKEFEE